MSIVSINSARNLYWMGRYLERAEILMEEYLKAYDQILDIDFEGGKKLFEKFKLGIEYTNARTFLANATFGDHSNNIPRLIARARENAILCRDHIDNDTFAYINDVHIMFEDHVSGLPEAYFIEKVLMSMKVVWGSIHEILNKGESLYLIEFGEYVERIDLKLRLNKNISSIKFEAIYINLTGDRLNNKFRKVSLDGMRDRLKIIDLYNNLINEIIIDENQG